MPRVFQEMQTRVSNGVSEQSKRRKWSQEGLSLPLCYRAKDLASSRAGSGTGGNITPNLNSILSLHLTSAHSFHLRGWVGSKTGNGMQGSQIPVEEK